MTQEDIELLEKFLKKHDKTKKTNLAGQYQQQKDPLKSSISSYVNHGFEIINSSLRGNCITIDKMTECHIKILNIALDKCPPLPNTMLYRAERPSRPNWFVKRWFQERIGKVITFPAFTSCSQEKIRADHSSLLFLISTHRSTNAFNINDNGGKKCEMEAIFKNNTSFRIVHAKGNKYKVIIELEEVKEGNGIIIYENRYYHLPVRNNGSLSPPSLND